MIENIHVGRGVTRGSMTVFPLWAPRTGPSTHTVSPRTLDVTETDGGPQVDTLVMGNHGDKPVLVLEGQLFEGGWQHRMATRPVMIGVHHQVPVEVACVEQGRWAGERTQRSAGRRATPWVRESVRSPFGVGLLGDVQGEVWRRVAHHAADRPGNETTSLVTRLDAGTATDWSDYQLLPGQAGVLIGVGGQPYAAELFDSSRHLQRQVRAILEAAALDAEKVAGPPTPSRRAHRFVDRFMALEAQERRPAGVAEEQLACSTYVDASVVHHAGRPVHTRMTNVRHPMLATA